MFTFRNLVRCLPCMVDAQTTIHLVYPPKLTTNPDIWAKPLELLANSILKQQLAADDAQTDENPVLVEVYYREPGSADFSLLTSYEQFSFSQHLNQRFCFDSSQTQQPGWLQVVVGNFELTYHAQDDGVSTIAIGLRSASPSYSNKCFAAYINRAICDVRRFGRENASHYSQHQGSAPEQTLYELFVYLSHEPAITLQGRARYNHLALAME